MYTLHATNKGTKMTHQAPNRQRVTAGGIGAIIGWLIGGLVWGLLSAMVFHAIGTGAEVIIIGRSIAILGTIWLFAKIGVERADSRHQKRVAATTAPQEGLEALPKH